MLPLFTGTGTPRGTSPRIVTMADDETRRSDFDDLDDAADETASDGLLPVGYPVKVTRAGEWLDDWAEILRVNTQPTSDNPTPTYDVLVKPMINVTTVSDEGGESVKDGDGNIFRLHSVWYVIRDKPYASEVVELRPDVDPEDAKKVAEYRKRYAQESWYRGAVADEKRRKSSVTVRVLRAGDVDKLASARANDDSDKPKPGGESLGIVDVSTPVDVNLYWMKDVLKHMKKFNPTVPKLPAGFGRSGATWFFHTAKSRKAMANNFNDVLLPSIREGLSDDKDAPLRGGALYLDGKKLAEDPEECGFPGYCHEYQRVCTWAIDEGIPFVFVGAGERYDEEAWRGVHHGRRTPARVVGCGCVVS